MPVVLRANSTDILDEIVCFLFLQVLPEEYDVFRQIGEREKEPLTIDGIIGELRARFDLSRKVKSRSSDTALVASCSRRGKLKRFRAKRKTMGRKQSSSSGENSAGSATISGKEYRKISCSICRETGQNWLKCSQRICITCPETGHDPHKCPKMTKEDANLAISGQAGLVGDAESKSFEVAKSNNAEDAFVSVSQGEREFRFGCSGGTVRVNCEIGEIETWIVDGAATRNNMGPNPVSITNYRKCDCVTRVANGVGLPIEGVNDTLMSFHSDFGETDLQLLNVAFVSLLCHNLLSLKQFTRRAGGMSLSDESFPNGGARGAFAKPSRSVSSRRLRVASKAPPRTLRGGCTYRRLHEDAFEGSRGLLEGSVDELYVPTRS